ncbi:MAG: flagellin [Caulobacterales bacterium]
MAISVHTNTAAQIALQNLNTTNRELEDVQNRVSTGLKVSSAKDNASIYAVAQGLRADIGSFGAVKNSLNRAQSIADVALAAGSSVSDLLVSAKEKILAALDPSIDTASRTAYNNDFKSILRQITSVLNNAVFDGANILNGSLAADIGFIADANAAQALTLQRETLSLGGSIITLAATASIGTVALASAARTALDTSLDNVNAALGRLGSKAKQIENHNIFVTKLMDSLTTGVGNLVDADLATESAKLQALQVKQQLGVQAISIANQAPQTILSLFRS